MDNALVTPSMHWVQWLYPGLRASVQEGHVRECVCAKWVEKYTIPSFAKCVQVITN